MSSKREALVAFVRGNDDIAALKNFAASKQFPEHLILEGGIVEACEYLKQHASPETLIVEIPSAGEAPALLDQLANVVDPSTRVVVVGTVNEYSFFTWLTEIGIAHYFLKPLKSETIATAYTKLTTPVVVQEAEKKPGKVVGLIGGKGGVGNSSVAILLAGMTAKITTSTVALVDLNPQDGSISVLLDIEPCRSMHEALEKPDRIDDLLLDRLLVRAAERFYVLSAEENIAPNFHIHNDAATSLMNALRKKYDAVVLDISTHLNAFTKQCLRACDEIIVVTDLSLLGLRGAIRILEWIDESMKGKPVKCVVNRAGLIDKYEISEADVTKSTKKPIDVTIHNSPQVFMEIANELKVLDKGDMPALEAVNRLAILMFPEIIKDKDGSDKGSQKEKKKSLLGALKKK